MYKETTLKKEFINKTRSQVNLIEKRFNLIREKCTSGPKQNKMETKMKIEKINSCIDKLKWRLDNFARHDIPIDTFVENSFKDIQMEIDWRLSECELAMEGKQICSEDEKKRINKNYVIREVK